MKKKLYTGVASVIVLAVSFLLIALTADLDPKEKKTEGSYLAEAGTALTAEADTANEANTKTPGAVETAEDSTGLEQEDNTTTVEETEQGEDLQDPETPAGSTEEESEEQSSEKPHEEEIPEEPAEVPVEEETPEEPEEPAKPEEPAHTVDFIIANVDTALNIRSGPSTDDEIVGKLYRGGRATILERGSEWTKITSGNVTGYASNEWMMFDEEAEKGLEIFGIKKATVTADALRVRREPNTDSGILDLYELGDELPLSNEVDAPEGWIAVDYSDKTIGYVSSDYVRVTIEYEEALTLEEEAAILEAKRLEEEKAEREEAMRKALNDAKKEKPETKNRKAIKVSDEDAYLIAACVHMEAGNQPYEGKLAVANVIINRMLDGYWGSSASDVIYARGQFTGAASGLLDKYLASGPNAGCIKATSEALAGNNNIGSYMYFCSNRAANYGSYKSYVIIGDHTFYKR